VLSSQDKANVKAVWEHVKGHEEVYGAEALHRAFVCDPQTQTYFAGKDLKENSAYLHGHGKKVMSALTNAVAHIDDIEGSMSKLSDKHAHELMVDPGNFDILAHHILTTMAMFMPQCLTSANHRSVDKFLSTVKHVLTSKYR
uniref:Hemoglobin subunit alpha-2 n=1 Tax=Triturus cristatus TaxID=8323 RepID=HBA2_TRICR|nr:RecName: Full=Hemoglobin subunit alpha-2; AltName: Full=Alpha-2-globin; AltName: Full=Hemoglobin alpha-2 chain; AltName: Full=Hemoglobin alpha-minor chain [Triturus cristatus]